MLQDINYKDKYCDILINKNDLNFENDILIDMRNEKIFKSYHIKNSINILDINEIKQICKNYIDKKIVIYCQTGLKSKELVKNIKEDENFQNIYSLESGIYNIDTVDIEANEDFFPKLNFTKQELLANFLADSRPWIVAFSGGKDSTVVLQLVYEMLLSLPKEKRKKVFVVMSDTKVESPVIEDYLKETMKILNESSKDLGLEFEAIIVEPNEEEEFWFNLIGKGYPSPTRTFRWCTDKLKIRPTQDTMNNITSKYGSCVLLIGTRKKESINRQKTMEARELNSRGLHPHDYIPNTLVYSAISEWSNDDVWYYLTSHNPPPWQKNHDELLNLYTKAHGGECEFITNTEQPSCGSSRFGCWVCTVVTDDKSMKGFIDTGDDWLKPLYDFRFFLKEIREDTTKRSAIRRNGTFGAGPFTSEARKEILDKLLKTEQIIGRTLITDNQLYLIQKQWSKDFDILNSVEQISNKRGRMIKIQKDKYAKDSIFLHLDLLNSASNRQGVDEEFVSNLLNEALDIYSSSLDESQSSFEIKKLIEKVIDNKCIPTKDELNED
ncbi:DNA phosphorothioation system sulfurtransferase DndC [Aliarcobacter cryaerophilus]|uniref:DNA phosphorothioation system sulfurtransferase DndC n=1 Tax=Aliarcobacter cryaerophilus TaxID=28198 RepID=UPI0021B52843|nr:DNA phosphorothioation system sulfurtransferase DndC [Aliarcobacter cryaerophilus]MCT7406224.1 DNA phosphorothioation system sulfurtransferase DndC [Aliarcobacter cryaerophilus]MCT7504035.1 DNA phosphorothioation system sulfurtransferase DndC [Aliarcobacter cryaerophilus]